MTGAIAWFAPNADLWVTSRMEHRLANALVAQGFDVTVIQCDGVLDSYCPVMTSAGLPAAAPEADKKRECRRCEATAAVIRSRADYRVRQLSEFVDAEDLAWADERSSKATIADLERLEVDGLPIGRLAAYTTMLHHKQGSVDRTPESWAEYVADLRNALLMTRAVPRIWKDLDPRYAIVYNALYPANRVFAEGLRNRGATLVNLAGGPSVPRRYATAALYNSLVASQTTVESAALARSMEIPCSPQEVAIVERHLEALMGGSDPWVYSSAPTRRSDEQIRADLGLRAESPVVTVIVSSLDETRATTLVDAEFRSDLSKGYSEPEEYLRRCSEVAAQHPEWDFVFRLHPRLAPNKRERVTSPDLAVINAILDGLPDNARINHPSEGTSLYDLVSISSAAVNHTSSAGLEFIALGVPVVQYDPLRSGIYPERLSYCVPRNDLTAFSAALSEAVGDGVLVDRAAWAVRWLASLQIRAMVHLDPIEPTEAIGVAAAVQPSTSSARSLPLAHLAPGWLKSIVAQRRTIADREQQGPGEALPTGAEEQLMRQLSSVRADSVVWEPAIDAPIGTDESSERQAVLETMNRLRRRIGLPPAE